MRPLLRPVVSAVCALILTHAVTRAESGAELVDRLLRAPGSYGQICDAIAVPVPVPLPAFQIRAFGEAGFSEASAELMRKNRKAVIAELRKRLAAVDFTREPKPQDPDPTIKPGESDGTPVGVDPAAFSPLVLDMIVRLKGIETLPELLTTEEKLLAALTKAQQDPAAPPPMIDGLDGAGIFPASQLTEQLDESAEPADPTPADLAKYEREHRLFTAESAHRDLLAVIVSLLRYQGMDEVLQSPLEKAYGKNLQEKAAADETLAKIRKREDIPAGEEETYAWDRVHQVARLRWDPVDLPYTPELRTTIRQWASQWIAAHPAPAAEDGKKEP